MGNMVTTHAIFKRIMLEKQARWLFLHFLEAGPEIFERRKKTGL